MAVYTIGGRRVVASLLLAQDFFLAVGSGDPDWDTTPVAPTASDTDLVAKVGVTRLRDIQFVTPDEAGVISMPDGAQFAVSQTPTRYVYLEFKLDLADASGFTLRENGIYHGTQLDGAVPGGQMFIPHADVVDYGTLMQVDRYNSIVRDGTLEQNFSFILTM